MDPIQKIYRLLLFIIIGLLALEILPFLSSIIGMLIFSFLFTTIFLQGVDSIERYTRSRSLGVFLILSTTILVGVIFIGSFISNLGSQIKLFTKKIQRDDFEKGIENLSSSIREVLPDFIANLIPETEKIILYGKKPNDWCFSKRFISSWISWESIFYCIHGTDFYNYTIN